MNKSLQERIKEEVASLVNQQKVLSHLLVIIGLIGLCFVFFGVYVNNLEETNMKRIISPELDWTVIGSLFVFLCYCLIGFFKFFVFYRIWKLKKEQLEVQRHCAFRYVHPIEKDVKLFVNQKVLLELQAKEK